MVQYPELQHLGVPWVYEYNQEAFGTTTEVRKVCMETQCLLIVA